MKKISQKLIEIGNKELSKKEELVPFTKKESWDIKINDLEKYSHLFLLGCIADKQIKAERAWATPIKIAEEIGSFEFDHFQKVKLDEMKFIFQKKSLHRFNDKVAKEYFLAIQKIQSEYSGIAHYIWSKSSSSARIFCNFLEFDGIGQKIASMAINILFRQFKLNIKNLQWIDVSPDRHVVRVFQRTGLVRQNATKEEVIWKARELNEKYPGVFDIGTFEIGRKSCKPQAPLCSECTLNKICPKVI